MGPVVDATRVLSVFRQDLPYLFLGAIFVAIGVITAAFTALRRRIDRLLLYFAIFAVLYGLRLWIESTLLGISTLGWCFYPRLRSGINYIVPIPAVWFLNAAGFLRGASKFAGMVLIAVSVVLSAATFLLGPEPIYERVNGILVISAMIALVAQSRRMTAAAADFGIVRRGLLIFAALVIWDNLRGIFQWSFPSLEPFGFAAFLSCLGYVAARRTLQREEELSNIQKELEVARRIQLSILPTDFPSSPHFQVSARYVPMTAVAGDFYEYVIASPLQAGLLVADVSGHGVPAALIASMVKLAAASQRDHGANPAAFLSQVNRVLYGNTKDQFVTAAYVYLDSVAHELRYSAAGHPPMLLLRGGEVVTIEENGLMLAAFDSAAYSNATQRLKNGDRLLLYTDGIIEAANSAGEFFGLRGLSELLCKTEGKTPAEAIELIVTTVQAWSKIQEDDLTVLVCDYAA